MSSVKERAPEPFAGPGPYNLDSKGICQKPFQPQ